MAAADYRMMTDATGQDLVAALQNIAPLQVAPLVVSIPTGQWSGSGSDYYITVNASNVSANSILVPCYDADSRSRLNGPVWCIPAAGSFTIHTSAIPSGTVTILVQIPGTMGEAQYQVLADVYSKSQAVAKADIVNNLTSMATDAPASAALVNGRFKTISSGSLHDIKTSGIYYLTSAVTDKPVVNGGLYIVSALNNDLLIGKFINTDNYESNIIYINPTWYTYAANKYVTVPVSGTTSSSGAIEIPSAYRNQIYVNALLTTGSPGFVIRRDIGYFTVMNNTGSPMANTSVEFDAVFLMT